MKLIPGRTFRHRSLHLIVFLLFLLGMGSPLSSARAQDNMPYDGEWSNKFPTNSVSGVIRKIIQDKTGHIYIGGTFKTVGNVVANGVAMWDGSQWSALADTPENNGLYFMEMDSAGHLYITVSVNVSEYYSTHKIYCWDGLSWTSLGVANGAIAGMLIDSNDNLYVGGNFDKIGESYLDKIGVWNGVSWTDLGNGLGMAGEGGVIDLELDSTGRLYVGGYFQLSSGSTVHDVYYRDGASWHSINPPFTNTFYLQEIVLDENDRLYALAAYDTNVVKSVNNILRWDPRENDGSGAWSQLGDGPSCQIGVITVTKDGGIYSYCEELDSEGYYYRIMHWDGISWSEIGIKHPTLNGYGLPTAFSVDGNQRVFLSYNPISGGDENWTFLEYWDGEQWVKVNETDGGITNLMPDGAGGIYAVGYFSKIDGVRAGRMAHWDGNTWSSVVPAGGNGLEVNRRYPPFVSALAADNLGNLYVGGNITYAGDVAVNGVAKWNGSRWSSLGDGPGADVCGLIYSSPLNYLYAVRETYFSGNKEVVRWDGKNWDSLPTSGIKFECSTAVNSSGQLFISGTPQGGRPQIFRWNGEKWSSLGLVFHGTTDALLFDSEDRLYVGGSFDEVGNDIPVRHIVMWDKGKWYKVGTGTEFHILSFALGKDNSIFVGTEARVLYWNGQWSNLFNRLQQVYAMKMDSFGNLYASGFNPDFPNIHLWRWNQSTGWTGLGETRASAIQPIGGHIYIGGESSTAGGKPSNYIADYDMIQHEKVFPQAFMPLFEQ